MSNSTVSSSTAPMPSKGDERLAFFLLAVVLAPALAVAIVGTWGFSIWFLQMFIGPPTG